MLTLVQMRALILAFSISTLSFLAEWWLDMTISLNTYRLYRDVIIGLLIVHFWDLYADRAARAMMEEIKEGVEEVKDGVEEMIED